MPVKTGGSHALAALVSLVVGTIVSKYVWTYTPPLADAASATGVALTRVSGTSFSPRLAGTATMAGLCFVWGALYHVSRHS